MSHDNKFLYMTLADVNSSLCCMSLQSEVCLGCAVVCRGLPELRLRSAWDLHGVCLGSAWGLPGSVWGLPGGCLGSAWGLPSVLPMVCLGSTRAVYTACLKSAWGLHELHLGSARGSA